MKDNDITTFLDLYLVMTHNSLITIHAHVRSLSSMEPSHSKISYAMSLSCQPTLVVSRHTISPICDQGGPPHSPKTGRNAPRNALL